MKVLAEKNKTLNDTKQYFEEFKKSIVEQKDCIEKETMNRISIKDLEIQNLRKKCEKTEKLLEDKCVVNDSLNEKLEKEKLEKKELIQSLFDKNSKLSTENHTLEDQVSKRNEENKGMQIRIESVVNTLNGDLIKKLTEIEAKDNLWQFLCYFVVFG